MVSCYMISTDQIMSFHPRQSMEEREWFAERFEQIRQEELSSNEKVDLAMIMSKSEVGANILSSKST